MSVTHKRTARGPKNVKAVPVEDEDLEHYFPNLKTLACGVCEKLLIPPGVEPPKARHIQPLSHPAAFVPTKTGISPRCGSCLSVENGLSFQCGTGGGTRVIRTPAGFYDETNSWHNAARVQEGG